MHRDQAVATRRRVHERRAEPRLQLVEAAPQRQQRRMHGRVRGAVAEEAGLDEVAGRRGLGALGEEQHECRLLLSEANVALAELYRASRGIELESPESIRPWSPGASLDEPRREVGVDVRHGHVALPEV